MTPIRELIQKFLTDVDRAIELKEFVYAKGLRHGATSDSEGLLILRSEIIELENSQQTIRQAFEDYR